METHPVPVFYSPCSYPIIYQLAYLETLDNALQRETIMTASRHGRWFQDVLHRSQYFHRGLHDSIVELNVQAGMVVLGHARL